MVNPIDFRSVMRVVGGITILLGLLMLSVTLQSAQSMGVDVINSRWLWFILLLGVSVVFALFVIGLTFQPVWMQVEKHWTAPAPAASFSRLGGLVICLAAIAIMWLAWRFFAVYLVDLLVLLLWLIWWGGLFAAVGVRLLTKQGWLLSFVGSLLFIGLLIKVLSFSSSISADPLSLGWSESSRFYYASLLFAPQIYGRDLPLSTLHPSRYFLQSLPFLLEGLPLWAHRAWQVFLWLAFAGATSAALVWRLKLKDSYIALITAAWFFLFLFQGAIYYHLLVMVMLVLLGTAPERPLQSLIFVLLASAWAGVSRLNWFPVPAMLAAALYFLELPVSRRQNWLRYSITPVTWFVSGVSVALAAQGAYVFLSGNSNNLAAFGSSFTSDLLWYRLMPNPTFSMGAIPGIGLVSLPLIVILGTYFAMEYKNWHPIRLLGLVGILAVLMFGGLVVSVKIGGGGDLHNMDAYMTVLGVVASVLFFNKSVPDQETVLSGTSWFTVGVAILIPIFFVPFYFITQSQYENNPRDLLQEEIVVENIRVRLEAANKLGEESLFINQRHLITFGEVNIPIIPEYEVVTLMEMAMSRNEVYLAEFYKDLDNHRFTYIVVSPLSLGERGSDKPFGEENDIWVQYVASYLACEYEPVATYEEAQVQILAPRANNPVCIGEP